MRKPHWLLLLLLQLLLLYHKVVCKGYTIKCTGNDPVHISHEWYQPGEILIGGVASHIHYALPKYYFIKDPAQEWIKNFPL